MAQPGAQALRKPPVYDQDEIDALAAFVASLGPGPAIPSEVRVRRSTASPTRTSSAAASSSAPTARRATTSPAPAARCRAAGSPRRSTGVSAKHIYEAMLTGPQQMPVFSDEVLTPRGQAADHRLPEEERGDPGVRRLHARLARPGLRGPVRLARRHRRPGRLRGLDRGQPRPFDEEEAAPHEHRQARGLATIETEPIADPGLPGPPAPSDRRRRVAEKRAERQVATLFGLSTVFAILVLRLLLRLQDRRQPDRDPRLRRLQRRPRRHARPGPALHRRRHDPVGAQADERPRDRRVPPPRRLLRRGPRRHGRRSCRRASRSPASAVVR